MNREICVLKMLSHPVGRLGSRICSGGSGEDDDDYDDDRSVRLC